MARTKKPETLEGQLEAVNLEIDSVKENLKKLKKLKKELEERIRIKQLEELNEIISASGKSLEDVKAILKNKEKETKNE